MMLPLELPAEWVHHCMPGVVLLCAPAHLVSSPHAASLCEAPITIFTVTVSFQTLEGSSNGIGRDLHEQRSTVQHSTADQTAAKVSCALTGQLLTMKSGPVCLLTGMPI
jgi:hypothetical protein